MEKSRNLTNEEFVKILQLEYFSHKLRALIYEKPEFKKMNNDIAEKKKQKILNLSSKFRLLNIFDSDESFKMFWEKDFLNEKGLPSLQYNPYKKGGVVYWDKFFLFQIGSYVNWRNKTYIVKKNCPDKNEASIQTEKGYVRVPYNELQIVLLHTITIDALK